MFHHLKLCHDLILLGLWLADAALLTINDPIELFNQLFPELGQLVCLIFDFSRVQLLISFECFRILLL